MMIGTSKASISKHAWIEVYRSLAHGAAKSACEDRVIIRKFPPHIVEFATTFVELQLKRHAADYSPIVNLYKTSVISDIDKAERVIANFYDCQLKDRRAFASWLLFKNITNKNR